MARAMKDSGIPWIGEIPEEWKIASLKQIARIERGGSPRPIEAFISQDDRGYNWIRIGDSVKGSKYITSTLRKIIPEGLPKTRLIKEGSLILSNSMSFGQPYILRIDGCIHDGWVAFSNIQINKEFLYYFLLSDLARVQFELQVAGGVVLNLNVDKIGSTKIAIPPLDVQSKIVRRLDEKCAEIESVLEQTRASIEEYKKLKQAVITQAVTKGIRPGRKMKASGMEWIGEIPEEWHIDKIAKVASFHNGDRSSNYPSGDDIVDEGILFVTSNNLGNIILNSNISSNKYITQEKYAAMRGAKLRRNDIVFCLRGSVGKCSINKSFSEGTIASSLVVIRPESIDADFLNYALQNPQITELSMLEAIGIGSQNLAAADIAGFKIPIPSEEDSESIVAYLNEKTLMIEELIQKKLEVLIELDSYKKSMIFEYVTGKKQVDI